LGFIFVCGCCRGSFLAGDYVNFQLELRENLFVWEKLFELEETFYCVCRIDKLNTVSIGFGYENLLVEQNAFRCRVALRVWERHAGVLVLRCQDMLCLSMGWQSGNALDTLFPVIKDLGGGAESRSSGSLSLKGSNPFPGAKLHKLRLNSLFLFRFEQAWG
jgi:hypothetical protein